VALMLVSSVYAGAQSGNANTNAQGSAPVTIVSPLPLPVTGTVAVTGVPLSITVNNSAANAVPVRLVDDREPAQFRSVNNGIKNGIGLVTLVTVPAGKQLVVEHVSLGANIERDGGAATCALDTADFDGPLAYLVCNSTGASSNGFNHYVAANATTEFRAAPGAVVRLFIQTANGGEGFVSGSISGYYEPAP
jgi:hypothetical protein